VTQHLPPPAPLSSQPGGIPTTVLAAVQYRLDILEEDLRLAPGQRSAWLAYRERVLKLAEDAQRTARAALGGEMAAPKRLDQLADVARDRLTAIEDIVDAGKALYAMLTPAQKSVADRRMAAPVMSLAGVDQAAGAGGGPRGGADPAKNP
jgi:predicted oxidoreductase